MSGKPQNQKLQEEAKPEQTETPANIEQEEEYVIDEETQNAVRNAKFNVNDFINSSVKSNKDTKPQKGNQKKNKKNKAVDYYDYAQKNGINYNIQYEDNQNFKKKEESKPNNNYQKPSYNNNQNKKFVQQNIPNKNYSKPYYNNNVNTQLYEDPNEKLITGSNKFDEYQQAQLARQAYGLNQPQYFNNKVETNYHEVNPTFEKISLDEENSEKHILDSLIYYFSIENLNKDVYIRRKLNDDGYLDANELIHFNKMKEYSVTIERITNLLKIHDTTIEYKFEGDSLYLRNKNWESIKNKLDSIELIQQKKKSQHPKNQFNNPQNTQFYQYNPYAQQFPQQQIDPQLYYQQMMMMQQMYGNPYQNNYPQYQVNQYNNH